MTTYSSPSVDNVRDCGIDPRAAGQTEAEFAAAVADRIGQAEAVAKLRVGSAAFSASVSDEQAAGLQLAVSYRSAAAWLLNPGTRRATGTYPPLDQEGSEEIRKQASDLRAQAKEIEDAVVLNLAAAGLSETAAENETRTGFTDSDSKPFEAGGTYW